MRKDQYKIMYELEDSHWWFVSKRNFIQSLIKTPKQKLQILDVGSGTGGTTKFLQQYGNVTALEVSNFAHPFLKRRKISFIADSIAHYKIPKEKYDLVFVLDVLYHKDIKSDNKILSKLYGGLKKGGLLCVTDCTLPQLSSNHDKIMDARQRYTKQELERKVRKAGFKIKRSSYIYSFVFPLFVITRMIDKVIPLQTVSSINSVLNSVLLSVCKFESFLLKKHSMPIGSSVIIVAQK